MLFSALPSWQNTFPIWINVFAHFGFVVTLAIGAFFIAFAPSGKLIVVELDAEAGFDGNANAAVDNRNAATKHYLVFGGLPGIMGIAGVGEMGGSGGNVSHSHEGDAEVRVRMHREADAECLGEAGEVL